MKRSEEEKAAIKAAYLELTPAKKRQYLFTYYKWHALLLLLVLAALISLLHRQLTKEDVLVDDHTPNLIEGEAAGGTGVKWLNGINGNGGRFEGFRTGSAEHLADFLREIQEI